MDNTFKQNRTNLAFSSVDDNQYQAHGHSCNNELKRQRHLLKYRVPSLILQRIPVQIFCKNNTKPCTKSGGRVVVKTYKFIL